MVPDLIWTPDFLFVPEKSVLKKFKPKKVGSCMKVLYNDFHAGTKFLSAQTSQGPNFLGPKKSGAQMRPGTISVTAYNMPP